MSSVFSGPGQGAGINAANQAINQSTGEIGTTPGPIMPGLQSQEATYAGQSGQTFGPAFQGFQQQQQYGGYDPTQLANMRSTLSSMQPTGGVDPTQLANIRGNLQNMQATGGYDPAQLAQTLGGYSNLASTGGYSPQDIQDLVNQATSGTTSMMGGLSSAAQRAAAASGGNAQAAIANIQQQGGAQAADAAIWPPWSHRRDGARAAVLHPRVRRGPALDALAIVSERWRVSSALQRGIDTPPGEWDRQAS